MTDQMEKWRFPNGEIVTVHPDFYPASCDHCGWQGSSEEAIASPTGGDDEDVLCPKCHRSGADGGRAGEQAVQIIAPATEDDEADDHAGSPTPAAFPPPA